jgi:hypothetical protein
MAFVLSNQERDLIVSTLRKVADQIENDRVMVDGYEVGMGLIMDDDSQPYPMRGSSIIRVTYHLPGTRRAMPEEAKQLGFLPD